MFDETSGSGSKRRRVLMPNLEVKSSVVGMDSKTGFSDAQAGKFARVRPLSDVTRAGVDVCDKDL